MAMTSGQPPYVPLRLAREHIDAIEGLWLLRHGERFVTRSAGRSFEVWRDRMEAHVRALADDTEDAVREASFRLASGRRSSVLAGAYVLLRIAPERCFDAQGVLVLRSRHVSALAEALARAPFELRPAIDDAVTVEAQSARTDLPEGMLMAHLLSREPRAGLVAAGRSRRVPAWAMSRLISIATGRRSPLGKTWRPLALYAWGALAARANGGADPSFAALVDATLGDGLFADSLETRNAMIGESASLITMAVVGHAATARRIARRIDSEGPSLDLVYALGLLGVPRYARALLPALSALDSAIRNEAIRALYLVTGRVFVVPESQPVREDGSALEPDRAAAEAFLRDWAERDSVDRFHLGVSLRRATADAPPSFQLLRAILTGEPRNLRCELLPGLFDGRPRTVAGPFTIAPGRIGPLPERRATTATQLNRRKLLREARNESSE